MRYRIDLTVDPESGPVWLLVWVLVSPVDIHPGVVSHSPLPRARWPADKREGVTGANEKYEIRDDIQRDLGFHLMCIMNPGTKGDVCASGHCLLSHCRARCGSGYLHAADDCISVRALRRR